jgi:hypothetical protein
MDAVTSKKSSRANGKVGQIGLAHTLLIVADLKLRDFTPEDAGKMNFYLAVLDELVKAIDIILCKGKNNVVAEYALREVKTPMGVASYRLQRELPAELRKALPAPEEFETLLRAEKMTRSLRRQAA